MPLIAVMNPFLTPKIVKFLLLTSTTQACSPINKFYLDYEMEFAARDRKIRFIVRILFIRERGRTDCKLLHILYILPTTFEVIARKKTGKYFSGLVLSLNQRNETGSVMVEYITRNHTALLAGHEILAINEH